MPFPNRYKETSLFNGNAISGAISQAVTEAKAEIKVTTDRISSEVSRKASQTSVDGLETRVSTAESNITQNADNIELKVSETDFNGNEMIGRINLNSTTATIAADRVEISGAAIFTSGRLSESSLNDAYDAKGAASSAAATAKSEAISEAASDATSKLNSANEYTKANAAGEEQVIWISKASGTSSVNANTTWVNETGDKQNTWSRKRPTYNASYPVVFTAKQRKTVGGTVTCTTPLKDDTTTVIDGGHVTTGTIDASKATITNINADNIATGSLAADRMTANVVSAVQSVVSDLYALVAKIGGFIIDSTSIRTAALTSNSDNSIGLSTADFTRTINGTSRSGLRFAIGDKLGVTGDGAIYASSATVSGNITATSGTIGGASIDSNGKLQVPAAQIDGKLTASQINASGLTIGISQVTDLSGELDSKADSSDIPTKVSELSNDSSFATTTQAKSYANAKDEAISNAAKTASNYIHADTNGIKIANSNPSSVTTYQLQTSKSSEFYISGNKRASVSSDGLEVFNSGGTSIAVFGSTTRIGKSGGQGVYVTSSAIEFRDKNDARTAVVDANGMTVYSGSGAAAQFGSTTRLGSASGNRVELNADGTKFTGANGTVTIGVESATYANPGMVVKKSGSYEAELRVNSTGAQVAVGNGLMYLMGNANDWLRAGNGSVGGSRAYSNLSDRRLKEHIEYLGEDADDFVRSLKPALFEFMGNVETGFYAQDVQESDPWDTDMVQSGPTMGDGMPDEVLSLSYSAIIAPLVAYCQHLEKRIEALEGGE